MFYRRLPLGHFLKVFYVGVSLRQPWVEKTSERCNSGEVPSQIDLNVNTLTALKYAIHQTKKHNETTDISLVVNGLSVFQHLRKMREIMDALNYNYPVTLFIRTEVKEQERHNDFPVYSYYSE